MARHQQAPRPPRKTPAERSEELAAASRQLKQESAERRAAAESKGKSRKPAEADADRG